MQKSAQTDRQTYYVVYHIDAQPSQNMPTCIDMQYLFTRDRYFLFWDCTYVHLCQKTIVSLPSSRLEVLEFNFDL